MTQAERRLYLIRSLLNEKTKYQSLNVPRDAGEQRKLLRSLMNVRMPKVADEAFLRVQDGVIGRSAASALYGDTLKNSATRLEKYAACAFAHFMEFGLQIRERDQYELKAADMGTVMHEALEKFSKKLQENGETWKTVTDDTRDRLIEECVEETMETQFFRVQAGISTALSA